MIFLIDGIVEVYSIFEESEFVHEHLYRGSIINYRLFFMNELAQVYMRFVKKGTVLKLSFSKLEEIS